MNRRDAPQLARSTVHGLVEYWASVKPDATAIEAPRRRHSYRELERAANGVATSLRSAGVQSGGVVAVHGSPNTGTIAAMLAAGKLGAAYLPLDPREPEQRVATILAEGRPTLIVSTAPQPPGGAVPVLALDPESLPARSSFANSDVAPTDLVYVVFTSGSTGRPKGVLVEHRNVVNYVRYVARAYRVGAAVPPVPTLTSIAFDASVQEILAPLARGDAVWLAREETRQDPEKLLAMLRDRPGAGLHCVPSLWEELLVAIEEEREDAGPPHLAALFLGGEIVRGELLERTFALLPGIRFANVYGPTETTVQATGGFQASGLPGGVGRPIDGVRIAVLDASQRPVPAGTPGEVYISGAGVGRGYLGDPELTAARFLPDPYHPGERQFRSGDEGVLLPSGAIEIRGRFDEQVKVRGFRVELGEVDAALGAHDNVARGASTVIAAGTSAARVGAAVVPRPGTDIDLDELLSFLRRRLPAHMVPARVACTAELPLTERGKLDRGRVAEIAVAAGHGAGKRASTAAPTSLSGRIAEIWREELDLSAAELPPSADFFQLGGHSLLATRVTARVRRVSGYKVPLRSLFDHSTLAGFTAEVAALAATAVEPADESNPSRPPNAGVKRLQRP
jgi:amino acid adenylation domain-containing protein